jgi:hypothetical protein
MTVHDPNDHLIQARAHRDHAEWLLASRPGDLTALQWAVSAAFDSALHGLTGRLLRHGVRVIDHSSRARALSNPANGVPRHMIRAYRVLETRSRGARYDFWVFTDQDVRALLDRQLSVVAAFVGM